MQEQKCVIKAVGYNMWVVETKVDENSVKLLPMMTLLLKKAKIYDKKEAETILNILNYQAKYEMYVIEEVENDNKTES